MLYTQPVWRLNKRKHCIENDVIFEAEIGSIVEDYNTDSENVFSDEYAIVHIMDYLIENAIKFTETGKIVVSAEYPEIMFLETHGIKIPAGYNEKSYIHISVADTGIGISEEHLANIFH